VKTFVFLPTTIFFSVGVVLKVGRKKFSRTVLVSSGDSVDSASSRFECQMTGKHLTLDLLDCSRVDLLNDPNHLRGLLLKVVDLAGMNRLIDPVIAPGADYDPGFSGIVLIETSHVSCHTWPEKRRAAFDLYSCKGFDDKRVFDFIRSEYGAGTVLSNLMVRMGN